MSAFTVFSNMALIRALKKSGGGLNYVKHVCFLFFFLKWDYNTDKQTLKSGCL